MNNIKRSVFPSLKIQTTVALKCNAVFASPPPPFDKSPAVPLVVPGTTYQSQTAQGGGDEWVREGGREGKPSARNTKSCNWPLVLVFFMVSNYRNIEN